MKDQAFLDEMKTRQLPVIPLTGQEAEKIVETVLQAPPAIAAQARQIYN
jgi:hypothetical protein